MDIRVWYQDMGGDRGWAWEASDERGSLGSGPLAGYEGDAVVDLAGARELARRALAAAPRRPVETVLVYWRGERDPVTVRPSEAGWEAP